MKTNLKEIPPTEFKERIRQSCLWSFTPTSVKMNLNNISVSFREVVKCPLPVFVPLPVHEPQQRKHVIKRPRDTMTTSDKTNTIIKTHNRVAMKVFPFYRMTEGGAATESRSLKVSQGHGRGEIKEVWRDEAALAIHHRDKSSVASCWPDVWTTRSITTTSVFSSFDWNHGPDKLPTSAESWWPGVEISVTANSPETWNQSEELILSQFERN